MTAPPKHLRCRSETRNLEIVWNDGAACSLGYRFLRGRCPCAQCVDEITGARVVDVDAVSADVRPVDMAFSGNYALKITWSDRHATGLYTWEYLARLCDELRSRTEVSQ